MNAEDRLLRVEEQVQDHLLELGRIRADRGQRLVVFAADRDARERQLIEAERERLLDELVQERRASLPARAAPVWRASARRGPARWRTAARSPARAPPGRRMPAAPRSRAPRSRAAPRTK